MFMGTYSEFSDFRTFLFPFQELWALFDFVCQGQLLGTSRTFKSEYENAIVRVSQSF